MARLAVRDHRRKEDLAAVDDAPQINVDGPAPDLEVVGVGDRTTSADTSVVAQHVDLAEGLDGDSFEFALLLDLADIDLQAHDLVAGSSQFGHGSFPAPLRRNAGF